MKKQLITETEYHDIIKRLKTIELEKVLLKEMKKQCISNTSLRSTSTDSFMELVLFLNRENQDLTYKIQLEKKRFLQNFILCAISYEKIQNWFDKIIAFLVFGDQISNTLQIQNSLELSIFKQYVMVEEFRNNIELFVKKREENLQLLDFIHHLLLEEEQLLVQKKHYEKQMKKKSKL